MYAINVMLWAAAGYLSGGVLFSYLIPKVLFNKDVRDFNEDKNPGAANAFKACGLLIGLLCVVLDVIKAAVPVKLAITVGGLDGMALIPAAIAPVLGHAFPPYFRVHGGKAIAASFGSMLGLFPDYKAIVLWVAAILVMLPFLGRNHSKLIIASSFICSTACVVLYFTQIHIWIIAVSITAILWYKHRPEVSKSKSAARAKLS